MQHMTVTLEFPAATPLLSSETIPTPPTLSRVAGLDASRCRVQVSADPVVSCPATSMDSRSSLSCFSATSTLHTAVRPMNP